MGLRKDNRLWTWLSNNLPHWITPGTVTGIVVSILALLSPRRIISFAAAVKQREVLRQQASDWEARARYESKWGEHWRAMAMNCQEELVKSSAGKTGSGRGS